MSSWSPIDRNDVAATLRDAACAPSQFNSAAAYRDRFRPWALAVLILATSMVCTSTGFSDLQLQEEEAMRAAVERVAPSVARIETFGGLERIGRALASVGPTSGLIVSADGYIVSSAFNFIQEPSSILVTLPNGVRTGASIVARDHSRMLVLLKVESSDLSLPQAVPRSEMAVGQWALAVGRTFDANTPNVSVGIVSATNRIWGKAIQTDAKISPNNYGGPLVDIRGRVLGVLVPLSPQSRDVIAGAEWYDSGIGFAIPLVDIMQQLPRLTQGEDLEPGLMGVSLKGSDIHADAAVIVSCHPNSPAAKAGLKPDDRIVEIDGRKIERQVHLKHALGPRYAGETVHLVVARASDTIKLSLELTDELLPYERPFLGILPRRDGTDDRPGVVARYVYADSPAGGAKIAAGDRIVSIDCHEVESIVALNDQMARRQPGEVTTLTVQRDGESTELNVTLGSIPDTIPSQLSPSRESRPPEEPGDQSVGVIEIKLPEQANDCFAYVPESYAPSVPHGVVIWLDAPGLYDKDAVIERWKQHCTDRDLILLVPAPAEKDHWQPTEVDFVRQTLDELSQRFEIDRSRIVAHGFQGGGSLAYRVGFSHRDVFRGIAAVDAAMPARLRLPDNSPTEPMSVYIARSSKSPSVTQIDAGVKRLREMKYPSVLRDQQGQPSDLDGEGLKELVRWIDSLDRI